MAVIDASKPFLFAPRYIVKTDAGEDGIIVQTVDFEPNGRDPVWDAVQRISRDVLDTREVQVRNALIKLGWTPPPA